jgi:hypothetical protein
MSTTAPKPTLTQARKAGGTPSSTATLMRRYGIPHRMDTAAKASHEARHASQIREIATALGVTPSSKT